MKGRLIVLEGTDGSGKATQTALLSQHLTRAGRENRCLEFPRYDNASSAMVKKYLAGGFGTDPGGRERLCRLHLLCGGPVRLLGGGLAAGL